MFCFQAISFDRGTVCYHDRRVTSNQQWATVLSSAGLGCLVDRLLAGIAASQRELGRETSSALNVVTVYQTFSLCKASSRCFARRFVLIIQQKPKRNEQSANPRTNDIACVVCRSFFHSYKRVTEGVKGDESNRVP